MPEPPPAVLRFRVTNPDASDYGRVGVLVDVLGVDDRKWSLSLAVADEVGGFVKVAYAVA